jgi:anaerobic magnesium-protoporphyrin IX monomethyl ester cyclase
VKILLLFPPDWLPTEPYLSLPALTSVLRRAGYEVIQKDINVEMYEMMFSGPFLRHVQKRITYVFNQLQWSMRTQTLNKEDREFMDRLSGCTDNYFTQLIEDAEKARKILRSYDFYDIHKLEWADKCLHHVMSIISMGYYPA